MRPSYSRRIYRIKSPPGIYSRTRSLAMVRTLPHSSWSYLTYQRLSFCMVRREDSDDMRMSDAFQSGDLDGNWIQSIPSKRKSNLPPQRCPSNSQAKKCYQHPFIERQRRTYFIVLIATTLLVLAFSVASRTEPPVPAPRSLPYSYKSSSLGECFVEAS